MTTITITSTSTRSRKRSRKRSSSTPRARSSWRCRRQNLDLLKIATEVAGYSGPHGPLKPGDLKDAMRTIWDVYSEFYAWIDPEESEGDDEDEDDEDDD